MISSIRLQNYRSYVDESFEFGAGVNIIVGPNGSGKTNLLEAIQVVAGGKSFRVGDAELIRFGADWLRLDADIDGGTSDRTLKITTQPRLTRLVEIDEKLYRRLPTERRLPVVIFEPNHLQLLHGSPEGRRNYLDDMLELIKPGYDSFRKNYKRVLAQRNALLKRGGISNGEMFPWNLRLSELGAVISRYRLELASDLAGATSDLYRTIADTDDEVELSYQAMFDPVSYESALMSKLDSSLGREIERGFTAYGPHREDLLVSYNQKPASETMSRGEVRTVILALKIIELQYLEKTTNQSPILLLDDVFSELDGARRRSLTEYLQKYQTFLTTTDADVVIKHFTTSTIIPLDK